jgi:hypothetical protein
MQSPLSVLSLNCWAIRVLFTVITCICVVQCVSYFILSNFTVSDITLRSWVHFELMLEQGERLGSSFSLLQVEIQFSQHHLLKRLSFLSCVFQAHLRKSDGCSCVDLWQGLQFYSVGLQVCFCASTMLFLLLRLCSTVWSQDWFFWLSTALAIWGLLCFYVNFKIGFSVLVKNVIGIFIGTEHIDGFWEYSHFHNIDSADLWTWDVHLLMSSMISFFSDL